MANDESLVNQILNKEGRMFTPREVCQRLGVSMYILKKWRHRNEGPGFVLLGGKTVRYPESSLATFIQGGVLDDDHGGDGVTTNPTPEDLPRVPEYDTE